MHKKIVYSLLIILVSSSFVHSQTIMLPGNGDEKIDGITLQYVDPLQKVFPETNIFPYQKPAIANVARGEHATFQFVLRSPTFISDCKPSIKQTKSAYSLINDENTDIGFVDFVRTGKTIPNPPADKLISPSGFFPDPIIDTPSIDLKANYTQPIWVSINIPKDCPPGIYEGQLLIRGRKPGGKNIELERPFTVHVYPVTIDSSSLSITNWFSTSENRLKQMNNGQYVKPYSSKYWELLGVIAEKMAEFGQNTVLISPLHLTEYSMKNGHYKFDFDHFDKFIQVFSDAGVLKRIEGGHIGSGRKGYGTPFEVSVPIVKDGSTSFKKLPISNETAKSFYKEFIPQLVSHLKENGWYNKYIQHIADEPNEQNYQSYIEIASFFKELAPDIPIIDAIQTKKLDDVVDIWVPLLSVLDKDYDYFLGRSYKGDELWTYICTVPQGDYANRFIELPLIKPRLVFWIMFKYNVEGYLHWGFNFWNDYPFYETVQLNTNWPGGDSYMVYPGYNKLYSSIRFDAQRDGIMDYELLNMLSKKNPKAAKEICNEIIHDFDSYNTDILAFRKKRKRILELLSK